LLGELIDAMDNSASMAAVEDDPKLRRAHLKRAKAKACLFLTRLNGELPGFLDRLLAQSVVGTGGKLNVRLDALATRHPELEVFRSPDALRQFMYSAMNLLSIEKVQPDLLERLSRQIQENFESIQQQPLSAEKLAAKCRYLQLFFCSPPPDDGPGTRPQPQPDGGGPSSGESENAGQRTSRWVQTLAAIGQLIEQFFRSGGPPLPPMCRQNAPLLGVLLLASLHDDLHGRGMLPREGSLVADPSGGEKLEPEVEHGEVEKALAAGRELATH